MNQILVIGDEYRRQPKKQKQPKQQKGMKQKTVIGIKTIIIFYAISIIILGMCMITGSVYAKEKINETVIANAKPSVEIVRNDENNIVEINIKHIRGITEIAYRWNDEEEQTINGNNQKELTETIDLIGGTNTLTVRVTEENGQYVTYSKTYTVGNIPKIELQAVSNGVKIIATSEEKIDYISYRWDNAEEQKITVEKANYEGTINAPTGQHTLTVEVVDTNGNKATKVQPVVGDIPPTIKLSAEEVDGKLSFIIAAEDDEEITKVEVTINGETKTEDVNAQTYNGAYEIVSGLNDLKVTVTNRNGLQATQEAIFRN